MGLCGRAGGGGGRGGGGWLQRRGGGGLKGGGRPGPCSPPPPFWTTSALAVHATRHGVRRSSRTVRHGLVHWSQGSGRPGAKRFGQRSSGPPPGPLWGPVPPRPVRATPATHRPPLRADAEAALGALAPAVGGLSDRDALEGGVGGEPPPLSAKPPRRLYGSGISGVRRGGGVAGGGGMKLTNPDLVMQDGHGVCTDVGAPGTGWASYVPTVDAHTCSLGWS